MTSTILSKLQISGLIGATALSAGITFSPSAANAACLSGDLDPLFGDGTNCLTFNPGSDSNVENAFNDPQLRGTKYVQIGLKTTAGAGSNVDISNIGYKQNSGSWMAFTPSTANDLTGSYWYSNIVSLNPSVGTPFYTRFTINGGSNMEAGDVVRAVFISSDTADTVDGKLAFGEETAHFFQATRNQEAVPGPLPLLGASAAFGFSRRLRRRLKVGASA